MDASQNCLGIPNSKGQPPIRAWTAYVLPELLRFSECGSKCQLIWSRSLCKFQSRHHCCSKYYSVHSQSHLPCAVAIDTWVHKVSRVVLSIKLELNTTRKMFEPYSLNIFLNKRIREYPLLRANWQSPACPLTCTEDLWPMVMVNGQCPVSNVEGIFMTAGQAIKNVSANKAKTRRGRERDFYTICW